MSLLLSLLAIATMVTLIVVALTDDDRFGMA